MAKTIKVTTKGETALATLKGQSKELLTYIIKKYGVEKEVDQSALVLDLNSHQFDTEILATKSASPISRLYEFYRSKTWAKEGWVVVSTSEKKSGAAKASGKWKTLAANHQLLVAHAAKLEELLDKANITYPELVFDNTEEAPEGADDTEPSTEIPI